MKPNNELEKNIQEEKNNKKNLKNQMIYQIDRIKIKEKLLHLSILHNINKFWQQLIGVAFLSLFFAFFGMIFIQNTGLYGFGVDAISHGSARLAATLAIKKGLSEQSARIIFNVLFWAVNFIINIPLFIFATKKINYNFGVLTMFFMLFATIFGISLSSIPGSENWFIMGNPLNTEWLAKSRNIIQITTWSHQDDATKQVSIIFYGILWAIVQAVIAVALLIINSSTAGFDILVVWYSRKKFKNLGNIYIIFHIISLLLSNFIGTYIPASISYPSSVTKINPWNVELFFNVSFTSSFFMILVNGLIVDILFPKYKLVKLEIYTNKVEEILENLYSLEHKKFAISINQLKGGFRKNTQNVLIINTLYIDAVTAVEIVGKIDHDAMIYIYDIKKMLGHMYISNQINSNNKKID